MKAARAYRIAINQNHEPPAQLATIAHELGHLFLGHLGSDKRLKAPSRPRLSLKQREIEAESVAYIVCRRDGITPESLSYLSGFMNGSDEGELVDVYQVMRTAGQVETILDLASRSSFDSPSGA